MIFSTYLSCCSASSSDSIRLFLPGLCVNEAYCDDVPYRLSLEVRDFDDLDWFLWSIKASFSMMLLRARHIWFCCVLRCSENSPSPLWSRSSVLGIFWKLFPFAWLLMSSFLLPLLKLGVTSMGPTLFSKLARGPPVPLAVLLLTWEWARYPLS